MSRTFIGIDFGLRRIGVAVGSDATGAANPVTTVARHADPDWHALDRVVADWQPHAFVLGVPYNADGSRHAVTDAAEAFGADLGRRYGLPVHTTDERYSSLAAGDALTERRRAGGRRARPGELDAAAAAVILSGWLAANEDT